MLLTSSRNIAFTPPPRMQEEPGEALIRAAACPDHAFGAVDCGFCAGEVSSPRNCGWSSQQIGQFLVLYSQPSNEQIVDFGATKLALIARMAYLAARQFLAPIILDSWVFWTHYLEHTVPWLVQFTA
jgi:hypothetical protein